MAVALASAGWWITLRRDTEAMQRWPSVIGEVVASEFVTRDGAATGRAVIVARYTVDGETFEVSGRDGLPVRGSVMPSELVRRFPVGATLEVAYDPEAPQRASLSRSRDPTVAGLGVALGFSLLLVAFARRGGAPAG
jgi:hypothetical protein